MTHASELLQPESNPALYVSSVLTLYLDLPDTPLRTNTQDQRQARIWFDRRIPLSVLEAALLLASLRRTARPRDVPPLPRIRSLAYFQPIIDEITENPIPEGYLGYLRLKLRNIFAARGVVWSVLSAGSATPEARRIRAGDGVVADPSGTKILVRGMEGSETHLFSVPLDGSPERKIPLGKTDQLAPAPLAPNALSPDGRLLAGLVRPDMYFNPPGLVDTNTGRVTRMPSEILYDYQGIGWTPDEHVIALKIGTHATMWKFQPAPR